MTDDSEEKEGARRDGQGESAQKLRSYREGGVHYGERSEAGPGSRGWADPGATGAGQGQRDIAAGGQGSAPGEPAGSDHPTYGAPGGDLGTGWGRPAAAGEVRGRVSPHSVSPEAQQSGHEGGYEGWSGRTGQDYSPGGEQSFEKRSGAWTRGGAASGAPSAEWHGEHAVAQGRPGAGEPENFRGEAAYNQSVREPYGAYQGGYPGEAISGARSFSPEYASWRAEQLRKLDEDYEAWCRERQSRFDEEFAAWRRQREAGGRPGAAPRQSAEASAEGRSGTRHHAPHRAEQDQDG